MIAHFIGENGFEACIEREGLQYRTGWKSPSGTKFTFLRCHFQMRGYNIKEKVRINEWTTFNAAHKEFIKMISEHKNINFNENSRPGS